MFPQEAGIKSSGSREPMLVPEDLNNYDRSDISEIQYFFSRNVEELIISEIISINSLLPMFSDVIWVGLMNGIPSKSYRDRPLSMEHQARIKEIKNFYSDKNIVDLVYYFHKNPRILWKESIKKRIIGLIRKEKRTKLTSIRNLEFSLELIRES